MPKMPKADDFDWSKRRTMNDLFSVDGPISEEEIRRYQGMSAGDQDVWLAENFGGDQSPDYYRGLLAGYIKCADLAQKMPRSNWALWTQSIIIFLSNRVG